jgi:hypothetical protein
MLISISVRFDESAWVKEKKKEQNVWKRKMFYKDAINKMLIIEGDFVSIAKKGDPVIELISKKGKRFRYPVKRIGNQIDSRAKTYIYKYASKDLERYRISIGYCLVEHETISFWAKYYWLYDTQEKTILDGTYGKKKIYFGTILSKTTSKHLVETYMQKTL